MSVKELYDLGDQPPLGEVPPKMHAFMVRQDRFGKPIDAWKSEVIDVPEIGAKDVLVYVILKSEGQGFLLWGHQSV